MQEITNALNLLSNIVSYTYRPNQKAKDLGYIDEQQIGLLAQDVDEIIPEVVKRCADGKHLTIAYDRLVPVLISAINELATQIKELQENGST